MFDAAEKSEAATLSRFNGQQDRVARDFGYGDTVGALGIAKANLQKLSTTVAEGLKALKNTKGNSSAKDLGRTLEKLDPDVIALCALSVCLDCVARTSDRLSVLLCLGRAVAGECWAAGLLEANRGLATRINRFVRKKHGSLKYRQQAARSIASRAGYRQKHWNRTAILKAGGVLFDWVLEALPHVFEMAQDEDGQPCLTITQGALEVAEAAVEQAIQRRPVLLPCSEIPKPWTTFENGGYWDERHRLRTHVVRTYHKESRAAIKGAMRDGSAAPHINGLNALQAVPWRINKPILEIVKACADEGLTVSGIPTREALALPEKPKPWEFMTDDEKRLWRHRASKIDQFNRTEVGRRVMFAQDMQTAEMLSEAERFYTPMNCDWRGRVYGVPHFNFQRDDRVRALFTFANAEPLGTDGLYWLKVHCANCGDFDKISKQPFDARVAWVEDNIGKIIECSDRPLSVAAKSLWMEADNPFLFLAACKELAMAVRSPIPMDFMTSLPVSFDGSCSGLQHLCAMTRAAEGSLVNLTQADLPQDIYQTVANLVHLKISENANGIGLTAQRLGKDGQKLGLTPEEQVELAKLCLDYGISREVVKRNVMTYAYSSKKYGMAKQQDKGLIEPLAFEVIAGKLKEHPFGRFGEKEHPFGRFGEKAGSTTMAASYLADKIYTAIQETVRLPEQAMVFLQKCARALAHEGKALEWTTPTGLPWANIYRTPKVKRVELWLHDSRVTLSVADGYEPGIDKDKAANGVAPNFVHALDAAHLMLTVNASVAEGITQLATVHDSFGCLASRATRFNQIIREQFVKMYEDHDVLSEVLEQAKCALTVHNWQRLPEELEYGKLNLRDVLASPFAFA